MDVKILLVEDERALAEALARILLRQGYQVDVSGDGLEGQALAEAGLYDVIILDRMLPGQEGVELLRQVRKRGVATPVILLTAKDALASRIEGLDAGADDYLTKPFSKDELLARVRALGRRARPISPAGKAVLGPLELDPAACQAAYGGARVKLTPTEAQLLEFLMHNRGQVLRKEQILDRVWGFDKEVTLSSVELYVYYLRKKIDFAACHLALETVRGVGYCLREG